ncbi:DnaD domain-containing protein [Bombilactobacillus bombi]|uniref:DnaD domain-containing protein n=1 Tax=Bombilactobacillus bombi TaxID=1303590 RepID=UPI0015E5D098|nr:DnaD domain protein [Bombilactobacillus bombi]MBA1435210.1 DnaD domain protein [Bombilactobacillus bombi]
MINYSKILNAGTTSINNLIIEHFQELKFTSEEFVLFMNLKMFQERGIQFPSTQQLSQNTGFATAKIYQLIQNLIDKNIIKIESQTTKTQKYQDCYDLSPVYKTLQELQAATPQFPKMNDVQTLFKKIEVEFGRPLSPIERQTIQEWLSVDNYSPEIISLALKEAVLNQVYSLKYMDRILINWEKQHITTPAQLQKNKARYGEH